MERRFELSCFGGLIIIIGIGAMIWGVLDLRSAGASSSWPKVQGEVIQSQVIKSRREMNRNDIKRKDFDYYAKVVYGYAVEGNKYTCDMVRFGGSLQSSNVRDADKYAREIVDHYPTGKIVDVYYNPEDPQDAVLEPGVSKYSFIGLGVGVAFIIGGIASCFTRKKQVRLEQAEAVED